MAIVEYELIINAPPSEVYKVSQDYEIRYRWDPFPERIQFKDSVVDIVKGVKVRVIAKSGLKMEVEFVQVNPPTTAAIVMTKGPIILKHFAGTWKFKPYKHNMTKAKFRYSLKTKNWAIPLISDFLAGLYFKKTIIARLNGLKNYCESQRIII